MTRAEGDGDMQVDFLIADHVPPPAEQELTQPLSVQAPGGRNALERLLRVAVLTPQGPVAIAVPDLIGALELKIEAYRVDSRGRERHLQDAVALASLLDDAAPDPPLHGSAATRLRWFLGWWARAAGWQMPESAVTRQRTRQSPWRTSSDVRRASTLEMA